MDDIANRQLEAAKTALIRADRNFGEAQLVLPTDHLLIDQISEWRAEIALAVQTLYLPLARPGRS